MIEANYLQSRQWANWYATELSWRVVIFESASQSSNYNLKTLERNNAFSRNDDSSSSITIKAYLARTNVVKPPLSLSLQCAKSNCSLLRSYIFQFPWRYLLPIVANVCYNKIFWLSYSWSRYLLDLRDIRSTVLTRKVWLSHVHEMRESI